MTFRNYTIVLFLLVTLTGNLSRAVTTIVSDTYNVTATNSGFALNTGINTGINPPIRD
jgi:hypothetical protein